MVAMCAVLYNTQCVTINVYLLGNLIWKHEETHYVCTCFTNNTPGHLLCSSIVCFVCQRSTHSIIDHVASCFFLSRCFSKWDYSASNNKRWPAKNFESTSTDAVCYETLKNWGWTCKVKPIQVLLFLLAIHVMFFFFFFFTHGKKKKKKKKNILRFSRRLNITVTSIFGVETSWDSDITLLSKYASHQWSIY